MNRKLARLLQPSFQLYFVCLVLFALISAFFSIPLAVVELAVVLALSVYSRQHSNRCRREIARYLENVTGTVHTATKDTMANSPLPMIIFRPESDDIIWTNDRFLQLTGEREHLFDAKLSALIPGFDSRWLMEGKNECPTEVEYGSRRFLVFGHLVRTGGRSGGFLATTYWVDVTEFSLIRDQYQATRPVAAVLLLDNYDELMKNLTENQRSALVSEIDARLDEWVAESGGMLRRYQRERYLFVFDEQYLAKFIEDKFDILDAIHQVVNPSGINATLSIGVGKDGENYRELFQFANLSDSSQVFIMGHRSPDNDCIGAAAGVCALCRKNGVPVHIIKEASPPPAQELIDRLAPLPEYQDCFLTAQEALLIADSRSLAVVVDTNRPDQVQAAELLESCNRVAVIDHHRRAATYIEGAALNYHEPYASSASEMVTELLQYIVEPNQILRSEAEALLAGIVLDTKNFTMRTGGRTFEAAAFLRRSGADTAEVKKLYQNDLADTVAKYALIQNAQLYRDHIALAVSRQPVGRIIAAQAADELLNIMGIDTSFVIAPEGDKVNLSARSMGDTNVQVILEKLGGGGNAAAAGGQVSGKSVDEVAQELKEAIDQYFEK